MADTDDEYDITKAIAVADSEEEDSSGEFQDEVISSDDDFEDNLNESNEPSTSFPSLELSDDEGESKDKSHIESYFAAPQTKKLSKGTFAGLGLSRVIVQNVTKKGFKIPTPIQRKTIPLVLDGRDVVGMARTGSGKTAAFVLPMLERLKVHSAKVGARAVILSPSRELALQTLKVVKEFSKGTDLRSVLLVGGDSLEDQFEYMMSNPDILIATPGRFLHLKVEMQLQLKSVEYIVFDEADRLFELGFSKELDEILLSLSPNRQTLLFSATLPKSLVEFAKAGLNDPVLVRLDAESNVSEDLDMAFFGIKDGERDASLCYVLQEVIKMPLASEDQKKYIENYENRHMASQSESDNDQQAGNKINKKRKFKKEKNRTARELSHEKSTIVFVPTKYHVEYVNGMLNALGYAVSYIYGALDQLARREQLLRFRLGKTSILVVTDVAARGIDIPVLANVINYSLPSSPKIFVHRVGRTARAGRKGWAYSLFRDSEMPYVLDLELFLGRKLLLSMKNSKEVAYNSRLVVGSLPREGIEIFIADVDSLIKRNFDLSTLRDVALRGEKQYIKTRESASNESVKRSKEVIVKGWDSRHLLFGQSPEEAKQHLLDKLSNRRVKETVFEFRKTAMGPGAELMARRRQQIAPIQRRAEEKRAIREHEKSVGLIHGAEEELYSNEKDTDDSCKHADLSIASEQEIMNTFQDADELETFQVEKKSTFRDPQFYMSHYAPTKLNQEKNYSLNNGSHSFADASRGASFDLVGEGKDFAQKQGMRWDKKKGKYVNSSGTDSTGQSVKYIRGEGGTKIPSSFRSGRYDSWKAAHKTSGLKVGTVESTSNGDSFSSYKKYKHDKVQAPKLADKARDDYHVRKKRVKEAVERGMHVKGWGNHTTNGIKDTEAVRKQRNLKEKRREKNARPRRN